MGGTVKLNDTLAYTLFGSYLFSVVSLSYLQPSLFSRIPPYLHFHSILKNSTASTMPPSEIRTHLLWPPMYGMRREVYDLTLLGSGHKLVPRKVMKQAVPKILGWLRKPVGIETWKTRSYQKVNSFPSMTRQLSYKDGLRKNQNEFMRRNPKFHMPFVLPSFILPEEMNAFRKAWETTDNKLWIRKSPRASRSTGIEMLTNWTHLNAGDMTSVVQKYVHNPILYDNLKVELKYYFLVTSVHPLRIYSHPANPIVFVAHANYSTKQEDISNICIHGRPAHLKCPRSDFLSSLNSEAYLGLPTFLNTKCNLAQIMHAMDDAVILTLLSAESRLTTDFYKKAKNRYNYFQIFSADFMVDESGQPWLMEINGAPLCTVPVERLRQINIDFYSDALIIAGYHLPRSLGAQAQALVRNDGAYRNITNVVLDETLYQIELSTDEKEKHLKYGNTKDRQLYLTSILHNLTRDDIRMLMITEDELGRVTAGKRIFPGRSIAKYIPLIGSSSYYYKLLDAWETKYGESRSTGRLLLENLSQAFM